MSEDELSQAQLTNGKNNLSLSFLYASYTLTKELKSLKTDSFETNLLLKNLSLRNQQRIKTSILNSGDTVLTSQYEQFISNKKQIQKMQESATTVAPEALEKITNETEVLEKELVRKSALFAESKNAMSVSFDQIKNKLKPNEVVIDLVAFDYYNKKWTDSIVYGAFVVKKEYDAPKFIPLFEQKQLEFLLHKNKNQADSTRINTQYTNKAISDLFLQPLEYELKGCTSVYLSPAGLGHQVNFKALPLSDNETFGGKYKIHLLGSTAELVTYKDSRIQKNTEIIAFGAIDYNKRDTNQKEEDLLPTVITDPVIVSNQRGVNDNFGYLTGTKTEIKQIETQTKQLGFTTALFSDRYATEESIKKLDGKKTPFVLHLATHGFFFEDPKRELNDGFSENNTSKFFKESDNPMMRSGLLFAGANKYWGKTTAKPTSDDGILTASEISNLDLGACELVVLSACETGLGEIKGSEGVFGLQRAFKMAGVKNIIMSLWKVPDTQTAELFGVFYGEYLSGKSIHEAFQLAQAAMKAKYEPYYWAGFVLLE